MTGLNWVTLVAWELVALLIIGLLLSLAYGRRQRQLVQTLEDRIVAERAAIPNPPVAPAPIATSLSYLDHVEEQITATRNHHLSLSPDRDIVLDIAPEAPIERQAMALRHAFLIAEKEAAVAADGEGVEWGIVTAKLGQIIQYYGSAVDAPAAAPVVADTPAHPDIDDLLDDLPLDPLGPELR